MMTRYSTALGIAAAFCSAMLFPQIGHSQTPAGQLVQQGEYGYVSPWDAAVPQTSSVAPATVPPTVTPTGTSTAYQGQPGFATAYTAQRVDTAPLTPPTANASGVRQVSMMAEIPLGYPPVITEKGFTGNRQTQVGSEWTSSSFNSGGGGFGMGQMPAAASGGCDTGACGGGGYGRPATGGAPQLGSFAGPRNDGPGLFVAYDALYATVSRPGIGAIGSSDAAGVYFTNNITNPFYNSVGTDFIDRKFSFGHRVDFGSVGDCGGWMASVMTFEQDKMFEAAGGQIQFNDPLGMLLGYQDGNGDGIDDDINGNYVHGRNGLDLGVENPLFNPPLNTERYKVDNAGNLIFDGLPDTSAAVDTGDLLTYVPIFDTLNVRNVTRIHGFDFLRARPRQTRRTSCCNSANMLYGVRVLDIDDEFMLRATGSFFDETNIRTDISNLIVGPTLGYQICRRQGAWRFDGLLKTTLGVNFLRGEQSGELASNASSSSATHNVPVNLAPSAFSNFKEREEFAPVIEWRLGGAYCLTDWMSARIGYTGMYVDGISRAGSATDYTLPSFGLTANGGDHLNFNALTFGLEFNR